MDNQQDIVQQASRERVLLETALSHIEKRIDTRESYLKALEDTIEALRVEHDAWNTTDVVSSSFQGQLIQTAKLATIGELVGEIAHEINNPLQILLGHVQLLQFGKDIPRRTEIIRDQIGRIVQITKRLVEFSRSVPNKFVMEPVCINSAIQQILPLLGYQFRSNEIEIELKLDPTIPAVHGSMIYLQQVFLNLFLNARDAIGKIGKMTVETFSDNERVSMRITDTGSGIPPEEMSHVFEPFYAAKGTGRGTGLGLYVSYGIVKKHGGEITVRSETGTGSIFTVVLPIRKDS